jgi:hypothetical protein
MDRVWQVRKLVRKMMEAKEPGGDPSKVPSLEALQQVALPLRECEGLRVRGSQLLHG